MSCPKCGFDAPVAATECGRCGIIFRKFHDSEAAAEQEVFLPASVELVEEEVTDGRIGPRELRILGFGLVAAIIVYALWPLRMLVSALVTLFHELGHTIVGWLLGFPSLPAFDFVYGGGFTHMGEFHRSIAFAIFGLFIYLGVIFRQNKKALAIIWAVFLVWLFFVTKEWRRELAVAAAGHMMEFILAGVFFYQALSGVGWRNPDLERPVGAFAAFFVQIHSMHFAWKLMRDPAFLEWYREGKGGMLMNDLEVVALDIQIYTRSAPGITGVAKMLFVFSFVPITVALIWYFNRRRWHRVMRALRTVDA